MPIVSKGEVVFPDKVMAEVLNENIPASLRRRCGVGIDPTMYMTYYAFISEGKSNFTDIHDQPHNTKIK